MCPKIWAHYSLIIMCLNIGTPKIHHVPFVANGKVVVLGVPIFKHFRVCPLLLASGKTNMESNHSCCPNHLTWVLKSCVKTAKTLIRLHRFTGCFEPLLFTHAFITSFATLILSTKSDLGIKKLWCFFLISIWIYINWSYSYPNTGFTGIKAPDKKG